MAGCGCHRDPPAAQDQVVVVEDAGLAGGNGALGDAEFDAGGGAGPAPLHPAVDALRREPGIEGLLPLRATGRVFDRAVDFRRFLQRELPRHLRDRPRTHPLTTSLPRLEELPAEVLRLWPRAEAELLGGRAPLSSLPIDHAVAPMSRPHKPRMATIFHSAEIELSKKCHS